MPNYEATITDFVAGDYLDIERTITAVPSGQTISTGWFTVKSSYSKTDIQAIIQKEITTANQAGIGWIEDTGADGTGKVHFYLTAADTQLLSGYTDYLYDIQIKLSGGAISTPELGTITAFPQITLSS